MIANEETSIHLLDGLLMARMATGGAAELRANADTVNNLNVFPVPDGDTGDNMCRTIESGVVALDRLNTDDLGEVMSALSNGMLFGARGNSGVILSQFFGGMAMGFENCSQADAETIGNALQMGVKKAYASVLTPTEGTILTVAREAVTYAVSRLTKQSTVNDLFADLVKEMHDSLARTPELLTVLKEANVVDSGGAGLMYIMEGFYKVLKGEQVSSEASVLHRDAPAVDFSAFNADSEMVYGYCTELMLQLQNSKVDVEDFDVSVIVEYLSGIGDSIVSFKNGSLVKIHVHTMAPEKVIGFCRKFGEFVAVKIENMSVQHNETIGKQEPDSKTVSHDINEKEYGIVAICSGDGIEATFRELGVDFIISGGQTNNPSTKDFLDAFSHIRAKHILVFPNNSNIIMAAKLAAQMYDGAQIHVVESKNLGAGYVGIASLASMDTENDTTENILSQIDQAMANVTTAVISSAVRDADMGGVHIQKGDFIGFIDKEIVVDADTRLEAACRMVDRLLLGDEGVFMLTLFGGKDATNEDNTSLQEYCSEHYPQVETYFVDGQQDIYCYIMMAEKCD